MKVKIKNLEKRKMPLTFIIDQKIGNFLDSLHESLMKCDHEFSIPRLFNAMVGVHVNVTLTYPFLTLPKDESGNYSLKFRVQ